MARNARIQQTHTHAHTHKYLSPFLPPDAPSCHKRLSPHFSISLYTLLQNFLAANAQCWWNAPLTAATRALKYAGHVAPGMLLVTAEPCALEVLRGAYARSVLKAPATYVINSVGKWAPNRCDQLRYILYARLGPGKWRFVCVCVSLWAHD